MSALPYFSFYLVPLSIVLFAQMGGCGFYFSVLIVGAIDPLLDLIIGKRSIENSRKTKDKTWLHDAVLFSWVPSQIAYLLWGFWLIQSGTLNLFEMVGLTISVGFVTGGFGINISHELIHRRAAWQRALGVSLLSMVTYCHWRIEHVFGHHKNVATPLDPATARKGEYIYQFWLKSIVGTYRSAWNIEKNIMIKKGGSAFSVHNRMIQYLLIHLAFFSASFLYAGIAGVIFFAAQSFVAVMMLETINYLEHYGLEREEISPGKYEPVAHKHSWDSPYKKTNWYLVNLGYHAHHHKSPAVEFPHLHLTDESPKQPYGYTALLCMSLFPPLWRKVMHPMIERQNSSKTEYAV